MAEDTLKFLPAQGEKTYRNPLAIKGKQGEKPQTSVLPDPYILKHNGVYYAYATGASGVNALFSRDSVVWGSLGIAYQRDGFKEYWAPAVVYENGLFYMYVSSMPQDEEDAHEERLQVATSENPEGPFVYAKTFYDTFSIDAHVVKDEDGIYYLYYSNNEYAGVDAERPGTVILADRLLDMFTLEGKPRLVVAPTIDEEVFEENRFGDGRDWHTIEGAFYLRRGNKHYMMYSGNAYVRPTYFLGYSTAVAESGKKLTELNWSKYPSDDLYVPLISKNEGVEGVGHNSVVRGPNNVDDWVFYHGRNAEDELDPNREQRTMRADPLLWCGEEMWVPGPSYQAQDVPSMPALREIFDGNGSGQADWSSSEWDIRGGKWEAVRLAVRQHERSGIIDAISKKSFAGAVAEASMKWHPDHSGGSYGIYPAYVDDRNYVVCLFDVGQRLLQAYAVKHGVQQAKITAALPSAFRFDAYHLLRVEKAGYRYVFRLDGMKILEGSFPFTEGRFGLVTRYTSASFAGVEITDVLTLSAELADGFAGQLRLAEGNGLADTRGDEVVVRSPKERSAWILETSFPRERSNSYRFSVDMKVSATAKYAGVIAIREEGGTSSVEVRVDREAGNATVVLLGEAGETSAIGEGRLPQDFDWNRSHTVGVTFRAGKLFVRMDRMQLYLGEVPMVSGNPGLFSYGNAAFGMISVTGV
ncbi:glycoside hydrolase family 43 protein [Cohnella lupini]|uniref:GH43 family beta-xylosidase n=1 Tax=Cohnella lupini TaxID=1294267 RepID=A0A3D9IS74_9BACL|nr:glycoside hydrolase family 43 protein [Cohnella lupini]RED63966.1 GH43 family beta-xylosidase [Cohnella lupini]